MQCSLSSIPPQSEKRAEPSARANVRDCHASCRATSRASPTRGSSLTIGGRKMSTLPLTFSKALRQDGDRIVELREKVGGQVLLHTLHLDEATFVGLEQALAMHPFAKKKKDDDVLCFRSIETPIDDPRRFLGLTIVNTGSRHHTRIELSPQSLAIFQNAYDAWNGRLEESPSRASQTTTGLRPVVSDC